MVSHKRAQKTQKHKYLRAEHLCTQIEIYKEFEFAWPELSTKSAIEFRNEIQRCALSVLSFKKIIDIVNGDVYIDAALSHIPNNKSVSRPTGGPAALKEVFPK